jgi:hypothetical protein
VLYDLPAPCDVMTCARTSRAKPVLHEGGIFAKFPQPGADLFA